MMHTFYTSVRCPHTAMLIKTTAFHLFSDSGPRHRQFEMLAIIYPLVRLVPVTYVAALDAMVSDGIWASYTLCCSALRWLCYRTNAASDSHWFDPIADVVRIISVSSTEGPAQPLLQLVRLVRPEMGPMVRLQAPLPLVAAAVSNSVIIGHKSVDCESSPSRNHSPLCALLHTSPP